MAVSVRQIARRTLPRGPLTRTWAAYSRRKARRAAAVFAAAGTDPAFLGPADLEALQAEYPLKPSTYRYDLEGLEAVGRQRLREMLQPVRRRLGELNHFLDLGMWDGTICYLLEEMGKTAVGIDIRAEGLTAKARQSSARYAQMDAAALGFAPNSFDFVYSFNSMEHFPDPRRALLEAWRVVRPGGYIYLNFGPIYYSPRGAHQFNAIAVPYCECLFTKETLSDYAARHDLTLTEYHWMNEWPLGRYRALWREVAPLLEPVVYYEIYNADHVDLIERYPTCFRHKTADFDDLIVSNIEALFRKRA